MIDPNQKEEIGEFDQNRCVCPRKLHYPLLRAVESGHAHPPKIMLHSLYLILFSFSPIIFTPAGSPSVL